MAPYTAHLDAQDARAISANDQISSLQNEIERNAQPDPCPKQYLMNFLLDQQRNFSKEHQIRSDGREQSDQ